MSEESAWTGVVHAHTVRAQIFEVIDEAGSPRAKLYTDEDGIPVVALYDLDMHPRLAISLDDKNSPGIMLYSEIGVTQLEVRLEDGVPEIRLYDPDGRIRARTYIEENRPAISCFDCRETLRLSLYLEDDGSPSVSFFDENEKLARHLSVSEE